MSSILEALRELEGERPPATRREIPRVEMPGVARRTAGAFIPVLGGLAVGVVAVGLWALTPGLLSRSTLPAPSEDLPPLDAAPSERPSWLDAAEAPRARVSGGALPAPAPEHTAAVAPRRSTAAEAAPPAPTSPADDDARPTHSGGQVAVEGISYSAAAGERVATLRIHGRRVTLRQREAVDGIEVQLIMPNGVYVQRGSEVYLLPLTR
jgi:hypothetical protein